MTLRELIEKIESSEFQAEFAVLSGFSTVLSAMKNDAIVSALADLLDDNIDNQRVILERIEQLLLQYDTDFMHPYDIPITAYLFTLNRVNDAILLEMLPKISEIKEFWWARKLVGTIESSRKTQKSET